MKKSLICAFLLTLLISISGSSMPQTQKEMELKLGYKNGFPAAEVITEGESAPSIFFAATLSDGRTITKVQIAVKTNNGLVRGSTSARPDCEIAELIRNLNEQYENDVRAGRQVKRNQAAEERIGKYLVAQAQKLKGGSKK